MRTTVDPQSSGLYEGRCGRDYPGCGWSTIVRTTWNPYCRETIIRYTRA